MAGTGSGEPPVPGFKAQRFAMYIVISKPKRRSVKLGAVHSMMCLRSKGWKRLARIWQRNVTADTQVTFSEQPAVTEQQ
jgi:hypothetical protein